MQLFKCSKCETEYPRTAKYFYQFAANKDGLRTHCKKCHNTASVAYVEKNKAKFIALRKDRYWQNREDVLSKNKTYCQENKASLSRTRAKYQKKRSEIDEGFHNLLVFRSLLNSAIRSGYTHRAEKTINLVGCDYKTLKAHLSSLFTPGMTWNDILSGKIHVDHIKPCCMFDLSKEEDRKACFHYTNLQPLWAEDNRAKRLIDIAELRAA